MNFLSKIGSSVFQIFSVLFVVAYLFGALNLHFSDKNDYCVMTYMFEYPQFVQISMPVNEKNPEYYNLYAYSEGRYTEKARRMWFDGVPVLFLPGNSGSHMQARSLASVSLRMAISKYYEQHFDFYTVSYNEELSGIYGGVLEHQTDFAAACISKILSLYSKNKYTKSIPTSVILIGHSMGGVIAKRLMAHPSTINKTSIAITLAAPLDSPVINTDDAMDKFYKQMEFEWKKNINGNKAVRRRKMMLSFGNGARDLLMPSGLTSSDDCDINALATAVPGVWVSPDHVSIVWCKQLVMAITRFLFAIVDFRTDQLSKDTQIWRATAGQYFQANRSIFLNPNISRSTMTMVPDAFWYEDSRRIYQISRPEIDRMTYLMIRLVTFPQNRFVAIEAVNVDDKDWIFGCNAIYTHGTHRYCKQATSINELSRWSGSAEGFGKRKLATIHLHSLKDMYPEWSHVIVKVSPTRKPIILNVDVNDHASRVITVDMPSDFSYGNTVVIRETEPESLYYELILPGFNTVHQTYLLYVEPTAGCKAMQFHVSAELHVPWAKNHEYTHYFTHLKQTPMKLRLFKSNPNVTLGGVPSEDVKVTLLLDPQCTYTVSISQSWYQRLGQLVRNYTPVLIPYVVAVVLLAARSSLLNLDKNGRFTSIHGALMTDDVMPYFVLVFARLTVMLCSLMPSLLLLLEITNHNEEIQYFIRSLLVLPAYMTAVGIVNISAAAILIVMVFSSQLAHRLLFRIIWRGGPSIAENVASGLQKIPLVVSLSLVCIGQYFCDAVSLFAGAAFYSFLISKMFEEYLEDYVYKLMAKISSKICYAFKAKKKDGNLKRIASSESVTTNIKEDDKDNVTSIEAMDGKDDETKALVVSAIEDSGNDASQKSESDTDEKCEQKPQRKLSGDSGDNDELSTLNFHVLMFLLWICVALLNVPPLLTWAKAYKYTRVLKPDTSHPVGMMLSTCSIHLWQMNGPRKNLRHTKIVTNLLFVTAVFILAVGPLSLFIVKYCAALMFTAICLQQVYDEEVNITSDDIVSTEGNDSENKTDTPLTNERDSSVPNENEDGDTCTNENTKDNQEQSGSNVEEANPETKDSAPDSDCDVCNENRIYKTFMYFKEKLSFTQDTS